MGKGLVEEAIALDIASLARAGSIAVGCEVMARVVLTSPVTSQRLQVTLDSDLRYARVGDGKLVVAFQAEGQSREQLIQVVSVPQHLGGERPWLICPVRGKRARVLYLPHGARQFASWQAHGLAYRSTREKPWMRQVTAAQNIRSRLKGSLSIHAPVPKRPKGMHVKTYGRLVRQLKQLEYPPQVRP
jgi:hypothetical protein